MELGCSHWASESWQIWALAKAGRLGWLDRTRGGGAVNARTTRGRGRGVLLLLDAEAEEEGEAGWLEVADDGDGRARRIWSEMVAGGGSGWLRSGRGAMVSTCERETCGVREREKNQRRKGRKRWRDGAGLRLMSPAGRLAERRGDKGLVLPELRRGRSGTWLDGESVVDRWIGSMGKTRKVAAAWRLMDGTAPLGFRVRLD